MDAIIILLLLGAWIAIILSHQRISEQRDQLAKLTHRLWTLEHPAVAQTLVCPPEAQPSPVGQPILAAAGFQPAPPPPTRHIPQPPPIPAFTAPPPPPPPIPPIPPPPQPEAPRKPRSSQEWEALIGGNILNKLGALLLVIGIMSFLAYYGTRMGPAGRAGCSVLVSLTLLGSGVWLERRETYRMFARGLIGAGWAALYATAYAIHAIPAARIIDNPFIGSFLLLLVAAGMIAHSLRYHAQGVTAVAFFSAFAALGVTPSTPFAVLALIPLAAAVLYLAQRFNWYHMALMGVFATYGACAWRGSSGAPLMESETLFIAYWVMFEIFDLMRFSRSIRNWAVELIFPLNAAGFLGLSYAAWTAQSPHTVWMLSGCAALLYAVSTLWRVKIEIDRGLDETGDLPTRIRAGCYEAPLALGAFLTATAIVQKLTGMWMSTALAMEAQALFTAGIRFRSRFLRGLAVLGFAVSLAEIADIASYHAAQVDILGHLFYAWAFLLLFHALLFYVNRAMSERTSALGLGFSSAASLLVAVAARQFVPMNMIGTAWLVIAATLFEFGVRKRLGEFRWQAYVIAIAGGLHNLVFYKEATSHPWIALALTTAFAYAAAWRAAFLEKADPGNQEWRFVGWPACGATAFFGAVLICVQVPDRYIGAALWGLALVLLELGLQRLPSRLRLFAYPVATFATFLSIGENIDKFVKSAEQPVWLSYFIAAAAAWIMSGRLTATSPELVTAFERSEGRSILSGLGIFFALCAFWMVVPDEFVPAAWAALAFAVLEAGNAFDVQAYRWQAQAAAGIAAISAFYFTLPDGHNHRILAIALLIAMHIGFRIRSVAAVAQFHIGASAVLSAALIYQEVSGELLTIGWGAEALVLLGAGFVFRERPLRLQGLALFLICVLKLFLYDLRNLDTPYRILSFIALGLILLGVSWIYSRFREQLQKLL